MNSKKRTKLAEALLSMLGIAIIAAVAYLVWRHERSVQRPSEPASAQSTSTPQEEISVTRGESINGKLAAPSGLPTGLPAELGNVTESVVVDYPSQNAKQLTVSYTSEMSVTQAYSAYKDYMTKNGYKFTESPSGSAVKAIFGSKDSNNLSVAVSDNAGKTLVQVSYLETSIK